MKLIDADALKADIEQFNRPLCDGYHMKDYVLNQIITDIENQPTVDAVPVRHGKFIGTEFDGYSDGNPVYYEWKCSECGCVFEDDEPTYNYCPHCGARMDEGRKEE